MLSNPGGQYNKVATSTTPINQPGYQFGLLGNVRGASTLEGPSNVADKDLGYFTFTVSENALPGNYNFAMAATMRDSTGRIYNNTNGMSYGDSSFEIVPEPSTAVMAVLAAASLALARASRHRRKSEHPMK